MRVALCAVALGFYLALLPARAVVPSAEPQLRIEAVMHTAVAKRIAVDRQGRLAVTASDDKTARVWEAATGRLLRVLRPPIGEGNEGKLFAVAITADGATAAVAGWTGWSWHSSCTVYLFDTATGRIKQRLPGLPSTVNHLAFSVDDRWLAASLGGAQGVRVWDWTKLDAKPLQGPAGAASYGASWSADGRLATTSWDGQVRLFRPEAAGLVPLAQATASGGPRPLGISFSPDGRELAVAYYDSPRVSILDGERLVQKAETAGAETVEGSLQNVAWSRDGSALYAAGTWRKGKQFMVRRWPAAGRGAPADVATISGAIMHIQAAPQGLLVAGAGPAWGLLDTAGLWHLRQSPPIGDFGGRLSNFRISSDVRRIQFDFSADGDAVHRFVLPERRLEPGDDAQLLPANTDRLPIVGWQGGTTLTLAGRPIRLAAGERSRSLAVASDGSGFVLGAEASLRRFNVRGEQLWVRDAPGVVWAVNIGLAAKVVVAAYGDGTIRWHRLSDGHELLALFAHSDRKRWVVWTPAGHFDASAGGEDLIGWHINRGDSLAADFFPASRFSKRFLRPDIIDLILETLDEAKAVGLADAARGTAALASTVVQTLPPVVELVSPPELVTSLPRVTLRYRTRSDPAAPVTEIKLLVDGQPQPVARNLHPVAVAGETAAPAERDISVTVPAKDSRIELFARNRYGASTPAVTQVRWAGATAPTSSDKFPAPKLYLVAIGVSAYQSPVIQKLSYAAKDAKDFADTMKRQEGKFYSKVEVKLITENDATRDNIADALDWLQRQVTQRDVGMLFLSGHGYNDSVLGFTFLPVNAEPDKLRRTGVTMADFKSALIGMPGKTIAFLDACHSGNVFGPATKTPFADIDAAINELTNAESGLVVFSSSTGRQYSLEDPAWNNGAFTKAVIEGIDGKADIKKSGRVTFKWLDVYVTDRVKQLTQGKQSPVTLAPGGVNDFPLSVPVR